MYKSSLTFLLEAIKLSLLLYSGMLVWVLLVLMHLWISGFYRFGFMLNVLCFFSYGSLLGFFLDHVGNKCDFNMLSLDVI